MSTQVVTERFFEALVEGDRVRARELIDEQRASGATPELLITDLFWPTYELLDRLQREDQITRVAHGLAIRLFRVLVDQVSRELIASSDAPSNGRTILACCGVTEGSELGAQMGVDLLEAAGFNVRFAGGGVPVDELRQCVHERTPDVLLVFCSNAEDLPDIRVLIDSLHEIGACPDTQIVVGGGVFNRAEGLAEEIGADLWAAHPLELVDAIIDDADVRATPEQRTVGRSRAEVRKAA